MKALIEVNRAKKIYKDHSGNLIHALNDISLKIYEQDFIAIMGPSGSGKTTLANMVGLLSKPSSGILSFGGKDCSNLSDDELTSLREKYIGFIFQDYMLIEHMTVLENVMLALHMRIRFGGKIKRRALFILERVGLSEHVNKRPYQLSGGQKQRVAIARSLMKNPKLILADEPTGALDPESRGEIVEILQKLNSNGSTIVMVTHNPKDADIAKRVVVINNAKIISDTTKTD